MCLMFRQLTAVAVRRCDMWAQDSLCLNRNLFDIYIKQLLGRNSSLAGNLSNGSCDGDYVSRDRASGRHRSMKSDLEWTWSGRAEGRKEGGGRSPTWNYSAAARTFTLSSRRSSSSSASSETASRSGCSARRACAICPPASTWPAWPCRTPSFC